MRFTLVATLCAYVLPLIVGLAACSDLSVDQQATVTQALAVACTVDGAVVPVAQPVVATLGAGGANAAGADSLLVHPAVVAACARLGGTPAGVTPASAPAVFPAVPPPSGG